MSVEDVARDGGGDPARRSPAPTRPVKDREVPPVGPLGRAAARLRATPPLDRQTRLTRRRDPAPAPEPAHYLALALSRRRTPKMLGRCVRPMHKGLSDSSSGRPQAAGRAFGEQARLRPAAQPRARYADEAR